MKHVFDTIRAVREVNGGINLDKLTLEALEDVVEAIRRRVDWAAEEIFCGYLPDGCKGIQEAEEVTRVLGRYAEHRADALRLEASGQAATAYAKAACESLYNQLPEWARW